MGFCGTPLLQAAGGGNRNDPRPASRTLDAVRLLLENGADPNRPCHHREDTGEVLRSACSGACVEIVELMLKHGAQIKPRTVHAAAGRGRVDVLTLLEQYGADFNQVTASHYGRLRRVVDRSHYGSPLHVAVREGHVDVVRLLLERKVDTRTALYFVDLGALQTSFQVARARGNSEMIALFVE
jgi:ankyrin repeat protein